MFFYANINWLQLYSYRLNWSVYMKMTEITNPQNRITNPAEQIHYYTHNPLFYINSIDFIHNTVMYFILLR